MFPVDGWNLKAGPKIQVDEAAKKKKHKPKTSKSASSTNATPISKKRIPVPEPEPEREAPTPKVGKQTIVTPGNVLALYEKVIEGKKPTRRPRDRKKTKNFGHSEDSEQSLTTNKRKRRNPHEGGTGLIAKISNDRGDTETPKAGRGPTTAKDGDGTPHVGEPISGNPPAKKRKKTKGEMGTSTVPAATNPRSRPAEMRSAPATVSAPPPTLTPLQQKMKQKLSSARFRHINEVLYTSPSDSSLALFREQPEMYQEYHVGFRRQVEAWPENPVDIFIKQLLERGKAKFERGHNRKLHSALGENLLPLPRDREDGWCTIADLGCGDAKIAATINHQKPRGKAKIKVLSYDLQASTPDVTIADIAHLPLKPESIDVVIFCLALMGTNFLDFVEEAYRILRWGGELWIAEIKSRFGRPNPTEEVEDDLEGERKGKKREEETYKPFVDALAKRGFTPRGRVDAGNRMFVRMEFVKMRENARKDSVEGETWRPKKKVKFVEKDEVREDKILKPCVYKLR